MSASPITCNHSAQSTINFLASNVKGLKQLGRCICGLIEQCKRTTSTGRDGCQGSGLLVQVITYRVKEP